MKKEPQAHTRISTRRLAPRTLACAVLSVMAASVVAPAFAGRVDLGGLSNDRAFDQFIVKYRDGSAERSDTVAIDRGLSNAARAVSAARPSGALGAKHVRRMALGADVVRTDRKLDRVDAETFMRQIAADPSVDFVEVDIRLYPTLNPNDTRYNEQWHYFNAIAGINLPSAWDRNTGNGVVVAVLDTGSTTHSDLDANTVAGFDFITDLFIARDGNGRDNNPADPGDWNPAANECFPGSPVKNSSWHGTHVAGTIAALTNNAKGVAGVAFGARVQHARVLGRCGGMLSDIADAVTWASGGAVPGVAANATPARIINMSLGGSSASCPTVYQDAINGAVGRGTTVIVAAGNNNNNAAGNTPANCANVVTVGAVGTNGGRAVWSATQQSSFGAVVDLAAPGTNVLSTINTGTQGPVAEGYALKNGTSMATPHVAGVAALVQSRRAAAGLALFTPAQLETHLRTTVRPFPVAPNQPIGTGIVNAYGAVVAAAPAPPIINTLSCSGTGGGYCSVSVDSPSATTYAWSGGFSSSCTGSTCVGVCGNLSGFSIQITVTVTNSAGSATRQAYPFCQQ